jgi:hypothetical protein
MKPVVSSLVALALAIAPLSAFAKPAHPNKAVHAKVTKSKSSEKAEKADKDEKAEKIAQKDDQKSEKLVRVKAGKKDGAILKNVVHHAHNVDLAGAGHKEPKTDSSGALVMASLKTPSSHGKAQLKTASAKSSETPHIQNANGGKPSKGGAEKGVRKPAEKKAESSDDGSGEPARDEEFAELVARIRSNGTPAPKAAKTISHRTADAPCAKDPVEVVRGPEVERFALTKCDGSVAPLAVEHLSILVRPGGAARPTAPLTELAKKRGSELAHGIKRVDPRLVERIQAVVDHFGKPGEPAKLFIISGYRPASVGSMHSSGRAIDFRVEGAKNEDVVSFCKTLGDTGCGYYPNSSFVHIDVRDAGAGHVSWIDASGPGETPRYVTSWPPPAETSSALKTVSMKTTEELAAEGEVILRAKRPLDHDGAPDAVDEHPSDARGDEQ